MSMFRVVFRRFRLLLSVVLFAALTGVPVYAVDLPPIPELPPISNLPPISDVSGDTAGAGESVVSPELGSESQPEIDIVADFARILEGASSGRKYYGYTGGSVILPHTDGGVLRFRLWNDQHQDTLQTFNQLTVVVGETTHTVKQYSTAMDLGERYKEYPDWGPGGGVRVAVQVPKGVDAVSFNNHGSQTGIELSDIRFDSTGAGEDALQVEEYVNATEKVLPSFHRVLRGADSERLFYGYSSGVVVLPHLNGGTLRFRLWNDQQLQGANSNRNMVTIGAGGATYTVKQYTTVLDPKEAYAEFPGEWGPGGGAAVAVQVPAGVGLVSFDNAGSQTGVELSDFRFDAAGAGGNVPEAARQADVPSGGLYVEEYVNTTEEVVPAFGRVLHGASTGRLYYGYASGSVVLPHLKGGTLHFRVWNDQHEASPTTVNKLTISVGERAHVQSQRTTKAQIAERYLEHPDWGVAGGTAVQILVPAGVGEVSFSNHGSQTGVEVSDLRFTAE